MEGIMKALDLLTTITPVLNKLDFTIFGSIYCMILEEWCKANDQDILEYVSMVKDQIIAVNAAEGRY